MTGYFVRPINHGKPSVCGHFVKTGGSRQMKQTRNRRKRTIDPLGAVTLEQWQNNAKDRVWAAEDPHFKRMFSVLTTERVRAHQYTPLPPGLPITENVRLGILLGYEAALCVLHQMAHEPAPVAPETENTTFPEPPEQLHEAAIGD